MDARGRVLSEKSVLALLGVWMRRADANLYAENASRSDAPGCPAPVGG